MAKWILLAVAAGAASGLLNVGAAVGSASALLLSHFTLLPLFLAGLGIGLAGVALASAVGLVVVGILAGPLSACVYAGVNAVPVTILCRQALLSRPTASGVKWYPGGLLLTWLVAIATAIYLLVLAYFEIFEDGLIVAVKAAITQYVDAIGAHMQPQSVEAMMNAAPFVPGIAAAYYVLNTILNGALAQYLLRRSGRNLRPSIRFAELTLPHPLLYVLAVSLVVAFISPSFGPIAYTLASVLLLAYFLLGLAVVHAYLGRRPNPGMALFSFYVVFLLLMVLFSGLGLAVAGLGIAEQVFGVRRRFAGGADEEDE